MLNISVEGELQCSSGYYGVVIFTRVCYHVTQTKCPTVTAKPTGHVMLDHISER